MSRRVFGTHRVYTREEEIWENVRWFNPNELRSRGNGDIFIDAKAIGLLDTLRERVGRPLRVTSAYRDPDYNRKVGGAPDSYHMQGRAFDLACEAERQLDLAFTALSVGFRGICLYPRKSFVHVDNRASPWLSVNMTE